MIRELPIIGDDGKVMLIAPLVVLSIMYFPDDEELADSHGVVRMADTFLDSLNTDEEFSNAVLRAKPEFLSWFWKTLPRSREAGAIDDLVAQRVSEARLAASVFGMALQLGTHLPRFASVNNSARIVMLEEGLGRSKVLDAWAKFKPVAHLWAVAYSLELTEPGLLLEVLTDDEGFRDFLSMAEALRLKAERQQVPGARFPLVPEGIAFAAPAALAVKPCQTDPIPPLEAWMITEIGAS